MIIYHRNLVDDERVSPQIKEFIKELSEIVSDDSLILTACYRDAWEQYRLYSEGRTDVKIVERDKQYWQSRGTIVNRFKVSTMALAGQSYHNYGLAVDIQYDKKVFEKNNVVKIAEKNGLVWGGTWIDFPDFNHFEVSVPIPVNATQMRKNVPVLVSNPNWKKENFNYQFIEKKNNKLIELLKSFSISILLGLFIGWFVK